jgi:hypothetical protein
LRAIHLPGRDAHGVRIKQVHKLLSNKGNKGIDIDAAPRPYVVDAAVASTWPGIGPISTPKER